MKYFLSTLSIDIIPLLMVTKSDKFQTTQYTSAPILAVEELTLPVAYWTDSRAGTMSEPTVIVDRRKLKECEYLLALTLYSVKSVMNRAERVAFCESVSSVIIIASCIIFSWVFLEQLRILLI
jgi:hypothetical protein